MPFLPTASSGASWHHFVKIPAASGGALEGRSLSCWGNLSPKPPNKDAIPPHRKQWGILASFREIRRWILEHDWLDAIVALPEQLFYNTGISTYVWVLTNRKEPRRRGKVQLIDASSYWISMRKSLGDKRREISSDQIQAITALYNAFTEGEHTKIFDTAAF